MENQQRYKKGSINAFQNAMSMMQAQSEAIRQISCTTKCGHLPTRRADPLMNDQDRSLLSDQFNN